MGECACMWHGPQWGTPKVGHPHFWSTTPLQYTAGFSFAETAEASGAATELSCVVLCFAAVTQEVLLGRIFAQLGC